MRKLAMWILVKRKKVTEGGKRSEQRGKKERKEKTSLLPKGIDVDFNKDKKGK